ncbi:MAG: FtsQ-type POTRA domain-containing protein [Actinobacteria bacterium]|uniref:Unannotated protein n=1 Tax=freshwater metagenome TaxID=449393 RepID=A0A6J6VFI1_9ZZZZ|nr:FtsQ-type POTRA domain-containing protein [Actinomycetota bacterium]
MAYILGWSPLLTVQDVQVFGAPDSQSASEIKNQSNIVEGEKLARLEPRVTQQLLEKNSWIKSVKVSRNWLNRKVDIRITARSPIAKLGDRYVDLERRVFTAQESSELTLPTLKAPTLSAQEFAIGLLVSLPPEIRRELRVLEAENRNSATLTLHNSRTGSPRTFTVIWGDESALDFKVKVYKALLELPENKKVSLLDLSAPHAPIVK